MSKLDTALHCTLIKIKAIFFQLFVTFFLIQRNLPIYGCCRLGWQLNILILISEAKDVFNRQYWQKRLILKAATFCFFTFSQSTENWEILRNSLQHFYINFTQPFAASQNMSFSILGQWQFSTDIRKIILKWKKIRSRSSSQNWSKIRSRTRV
jgi:hypothetical protein